MSLKTSTAINEFSFAYSHTLCWVSRHVRLRNIVEKSVKPLYKNRLLQISNIYSLSSFANQALHRVVLNLYL
jgi:hypothetical protein